MKQPKSMFPPYEIGAKQVAPRDAKGGEIGYPGGITAWVNRVVDGAIPFPCIVLMPGHERFCKERRKV